MNKYFYVLKKAIPSGLLLVLFIVSSFQNNISKYSVGQVVEDFSLKNIDNRIVSLSDYSSKKGVIIIFTCNTCPIAVKYENRIKMLHQKYAVKSFPVIAINPNDAKRKPGDAFDKMVQRAKKREFDFSYLIDENQDVARAFGAIQTPQAYVLSNVDNKFIVKYIGAIDNNVEDAKKASKNYIEEAVEALLNNKNIEETETKADGCAIKWKE